MAPRSIVVVKLSALGDVLNTLPVVRTLQSVWPQTRIQWVIGKAAYGLLQSITDIDFLVLDKTQGRQGRRHIQQTLNAAGGCEVLLHMQYAWRASLLVAGIKATTKIGFDRERAQDLQWLFTNQRVAAKPRQHVLDAHFEFAKALGVSERQLRWDIPILPEALAQARQWIPADTPTVIISPCSSHPLRNWRAERYAAVADHLVTKGYQVVLSGGRSEMEQRMGSAISQHMRHPVTNVIGQDTLPELIATVSRACAVISPDSGPAHLANALNVPVIGLYAATNPQRSGPYRFIPYCVDRFAAAAQRFCNKSPAELPWRSKIERPGVMDLISVDDVLERFSVLEHERLTRP
jgi:heptosyltransferase I